MTTNMNMMNLILRSGNPQQFIINMIKEQSGNNPFFANLLSLAQKGDGQNIEAIARNMFKEKGLDFDKEFNAFRKSLNI